MTIRFYIVPTLTTGELYPSQTAGSYPAYIEAAGCVVLWSMQYGLEPYTLVMTDATTAQHTAINGNADAIAIPVNIDNNVSAAALDNVQAALETIGVPSNWVTTNHTYRQILRMVGGLFVFAQRYRSQTGLRLFRGGVTLNTQFSALPANERQRLIDCADSFNYDRSTLSGSSTIRQILKALADQWGDTPLCERGGVVML